MAGDENKATPGKDDDRQSVREDRDLETVTREPNTPIVITSPSDTGKITLPAQVGHVKVMHGIGRGGMGVVFLGWDELLHRDVAVKFLSSVVADQDDPRFRRFFGGARAEAVVKHPNIVAVHAAGLVEGIPYIVMDYIAGPTLRDMTKQDPSLTFAAAIKVMWDVSGATAALHARDAVHRDLKPSNVLFNLEGRLFVTDFGLAALKRRDDTTGAATGTPGYMAPEAFEGRASPQSDVYAMGIMLFELLAGRLPFTGDQAALRDQHARTPLPVDALPDRVPDSIVEVMERAAHKKEVFRYKSGEHFQRALRDTVATVDLLREGESELQTAVIKLRTRAPEPSGSKETDDPSTSTYFGLLSSMAEGKRATRTPSDANEGEPAAPDDRAAPLTESEHRPTGPRLPSGIPCIRCGYNLRGMAVDGNCPECGSEVASSLKPDRLVFAYPKSLANIARGLSVILWTLGITAGLLFGLIGGVLILQANGMEIPGETKVVHESGRAFVTYNNLQIFIKIIMVALCSVAVMVGILVATRRIADGVRTGTGEIVRWSTRVSAVLYALAAVAPVPLWNLVKTVVEKTSNGVSVGPVMPELVTVLDITLAALVGSTVLGFLLWLAWLARKIPDRLLVLWSCVLGPVFAVLILSPVLIRDWWGSLFSRFLSNMLFVAAAVTVIAIFVLLLAYRRALRNLIEEHVPLDALIPADGD